MIPSPTFLSVLMALFGVRGFAAASSCSLCGYGNQVPGLALEGDTQGDGLSCSQLVNALPGIEDGTQDCHNLQLAAFQTGCCGNDSDYVPHHACSLCPDASPYRVGIEIPGSQGRRDLTCGDLVAEPAFLDFFSSPGDCGDTFLQRSAAWCQCPGVELECTLCPGGTSPPNPDRMEHVLYGWTCRSFEFVTALLSRDECPNAAEIFEFDAAAFCCPDTVPPPEVCSLCPESQSVHNKDIVVASEYGTLTCGEIEESLSLIPTRESCEFALAKFPVNECCRDGNVGGRTHSGADKPVSRICASLVLLSTTLGIWQILGMTQS